MGQRIIIFHLFSYFCIVISNPKPSIKKPLAYFEARSNNMHLGKIHEYFTLRVKPELYTDLETTPNNTTNNEKFVDENIVTHLKETYIESAKDKKEIGLTAENDDFLYYLRSELNKQVEFIQDIITDKYKSTLDFEPKEFKNFLRVDIIESIYLIYKNNCDFFNENYLYVNSLNEILNFIKYRYSDFVTSDISFLEIEENSEIDYSKLNLSERIDLVFGFTTSVKMPTEVDNILLPEEYEIFKDNLILFLSDKEFNPVKKVHFKGIEDSPLNYLFYILKNINGVRKLTAKNFYLFVEKVVSNYNESNRSTFENKLKSTFDIKTYINILPKFVYNFYIKNL